MGKEAGMAKFKTIDSHLPKVTQETTNNPGEIVDLRIEI
jgi:hypothetical protein